MSDFKKQGSALGTVLWPIGFVAIYFAAQLWFLPSMGVGT
jgi:hypothetical protein